MREIVPNLWLIDEIGENVHCYLWQWQDGITLIDAGHPKDGALILATLRKHGYADHALQRIIVTHVDLDHTRTHRQPSQDRTSRASSVHCALLKTCWDSAINCIQTAFKSRNSRGDP